MVLRILRDAWARHLDRVEAAAWDGTGLEKVPWEQQQFAEGVAVLEEYQALKLLLVDHQV